MSAAPQLLNEMNCTLFIIDDDDIFHRILEIMVQKSNTFEKVTHFNRSKNGLEYLVTHKSDAAMLPDVLFVDLSMPEMNGWEVLDELRPLLPLLSKQITVYIVTTAISSFEMARAEKYPFVSEFISKPVSFDKLVAIHELAVKKVEKSAQQTLDGLGVRPVTE